jgi:hypothetical protein
MLKMCPKFAENVALLSKIFSEIGLKLAPKFVTNWIEILSEIVYLLKSFLNIENVSEIC